MKICTCLGLFTGLGLFLLTACSSGTATPSAPLERSAQLARASFRGAVAYVADTGNDAVYVYRAGVNDPKRLATISGLQLPFGVALDSAGDLFVANTNAGDIPVYKAGTTSLLRTLNFPAGNPITLAFNRHGALFAVDGSGDVAKYPPGSISPSQTFSLKQTTQLDSMGQIAFDSAGNLYAALVPQIEKPAHVFKFAPGATIGTDLNLDITNNSTNPGLAIDSQGRIYVSNYEDVDVFPPGSREPSGQIGKPATNPVGFLAIDGSGDVYLARRDIVTPFGVQDGYVLEYGSNGTLIARINNLISPAAVAISATAP